MWVWNHKHVEALIWSKINSYFYSIPDSYFQSWRSWISVMRKINNPLENIFFLPKQRNFCLKQKSLSEIMCLRPVEFLYLRSKYWMYFWWSPNAYVFICFNLRWSRKEIFPTKEKIWSQNIFPQFLASGYHHMFHWYNFFLY